MQTHRVQLVRHSSAEAGGCGENENRFTNRWSRTRELKKRWIGLLSKNNWSFVYHYWNRLRDATCVRVHTAHRKHWYHPESAESSWKWWKFSIESIDAVDLLILCCPINRLCRSGANAHSESIYWCREHMTPARWIRCRSAVVEYQNQTFHFRCQIDFQLICWHRIFRALEWKWSGVEHFHTHTHTHTRVRACTFYDERFDSAENM